MEQLEVLFDAKNGTPEGDELEVRLDVGAIGFKSPMQQLLSAGRIKPGRRMGATLVRTKH